ncbi:Uncharacterized protein FVE85_5752 [Porphyridium purpureum]|uniref:2-phosphoglycerate kinase n=1 Tax=Porphyridium purpureum TaxID=35688 RepID=A0A5J4Z695_PORPP|nr:Uncharacterized protein FVE85_5752 [Porphyridium purpureum]|eukprot:POR2249..scf295_1
MAHVTLIQAWKEAWWDHDVGKLGHEQAGGSSRLGASAADVAPAALTAEAQKFLAGIVENSGLGAESAGGLLGCSLHPVMYEAFPERPSSARRMQRGYEVPTDLGATDKDAVHIIQQRRRKQQRASAEAAKAAATGTRKPATGKAFSSQCNSGLTEAHSTFRTAEQHDLQRNAQCHIVSRATVERILCLVGCKPILALRAVNRLFACLERDAAPSVQEQGLQTASAPSGAFVANILDVDLVKLLESVLVAEGYRGDADTPDDLHLALLNITGQFPLVVLLGGTSGCGKSTLGSLLANRLGWSGVLSTDAVRNVLRSSEKFANIDDFAALSRSTYEEAPVGTGATRIPGQAMAEEEQGAPSLLARNRILKRYKEQVDLVIPHLKVAIRGARLRGESLVVEGVHLTPKHMLQIMLEFPGCIPFMLHIRSEQKHEERLSVRAKYMSADAQHNKYVKHLRSIRIIQSYLVAKAEDRSIPLINNTNVDVSLAMLHRTVFASAGRVYNGHSLVDAQLKKSLVSLDRKCSSKDAMAVIELRREAKRSALSTTIKAEQAIRVMDDGSVEDVQEDDTERGMLRHLGESAPPISDPDAEVRADVDVDPNTVHSASVCRSHFMGDAGTDPSEGRTRARSSKQMRASLLGRVSELKAASCDDALGSRGQNKAFYSSEDAGSASLASDAEDNAQYWTPGQRQRHRAERPKLSTGK